MFQLVESDQSRRACSSSAPAAVVALPTLLADTRRGPEAPVERTGAEPLSPEISAALLSANMFTRSRGGAALGTLPRENSEAVFKASLSLLRDPTSEVRLKALDLLGADPYRAYPYLESRRDEIVERLRAVVEGDPEAGVRSRAVAALAAQGLPGMREILRFAADPRETVRFDVAWALLRFREQPAAISTLRTLEQDNCADVGKVARALLLGY